MRKSSILVLAILLTLSVSALNCSYGVISALDVSSPDAGFGFQNGNYIYFRDPISFDSVEQIASSNSTYGDWVFFKEAGANEIFGFHSSGVNVTVNNYFLNNILELACVGSGTVQVQVYTRSSPVSVSGASANFDPVNHIASIAVSSSNIVQLNWNPNNPNPTPAPGGGGGDNPTPNPTNPQPSITQTPLPSTPLGGKTFIVDDVNLGEIAANTSVTANLHFQFAGSSITLKSLSLPAPFNGWYIPSDISRYTYVLSSNGVGSGDYTLMFNVSDVSVAGQSGVFTLSATDAFNVVHTASAKISFGETSESSTGVFQFIFQNPLVVGLGVLCIIIFVSLGVLASRRRR